MDKNLKSIAMQLSEKDLKELIRIKKTKDKKIVTLRSKREKIVTQLAAVDAEIAKLTDDSPTQKAEPAKRRGAPRGVARQGKVNFVSKVREVFTQADAPLRAREIVEKLPMVGVKVKDAAYARKRVSIALATNKCFKQVSRGVYELASD